MDNKMDSIHTSKKAMDGKDTSKEAMDSKEGTDPKRTIRVAGSFQDMNLQDNLLRGILAYGFEKPSGVQSQAIEPVINGFDAIVQAQSGGGKTATFGIASLQNIDPAIDSCQVIIVSPTREIADQTTIVIGKLSQYLNINIMGVWGGKKLDHREVGKAQVIIGTPGRIYDMISRGVINMKTLELFILDEADQMLNVGFKEQIIEIFKFVRQADAETGETAVQIAIYSATMPIQILSLTDRFMTDPIKILVKQENLTLEGISQFYINLDMEDHKIGVLSELFAEISVGQTVIFCNDKRKVSWLHATLTEEGYPVSKIHGDITQTERNGIMQEFRTGKTRVLISTDLLSRGIDVQQVSLVINYDLPKERESYIHRIGRTGRFGRKGMAINFILRNTEDVRKMQDIEVFYSTQISELPAEIPKIV